ncbi:S8 family peptidase [Planktothrix agardhii]|uniref:S8 family peptidase n=1 Tax=Planktothrix agardhii TaxID=1160 RepID=UPI001D0B91FB|nr:PatA/PatG family cyanobactin maturation protease [Planktothrix agardhii]MCB8787422.1 PatA/PatG family cyanobactin maturation protease [Planktothrix agardhii 1025]MCF3610805.1 PatA/PatG family cyanobactin maturation protease [Planktothrix agardhii 1027]MCF3644404.1 PatA/PatG family cyanobactin maturation protease [Planktothrix agardhii 1026]
MPDLITIPGIPELWTHTKGDSRIKIAILDGAADLDRACFKGAKITQFKPYWAEDIELNDEYYHYLKLATEFNQQQKAKKEDPDHDKEEAKKEREAFFKDFPEDIKRRIDLSSHATHISSTILGQHGSPVEGIAPNCTAINIPISFAGDDFISFVNLTHAINEALKAEVNIIHIAACHPTQSGMAQEIFARAVKQCQDSNILIVAPGGNDKGECWCIPSILPDVLTVGAMRDDGQPFKFSNYGGEYQHKGVMANGENILGANPGTDEPVREKGTSCAAPIVTGISALLMSMQLQRGEKPNAETVRQAILKSAIPCDQNEVEEPERCLLGKLNIPGAYNLLTGERLTTVKTSEIRQSEITIPVNNITPLTKIENPINSPLLTLSNVIASNSSAVAVANITASQPTNGITASAASKLVYVLGTIGYDFGSEARRDSFKQLMPAVEIDGITIPANPYDASQIVNYLAENSSESKSLIWTINQEFNPVYALEVKGGFAADVYEMLNLMLAGQIEPESSDDYVERVSIPGQITDKTITLFSGQEVPVITINNIRGMYGWKVNGLVDAALQTLSEELADANEIQMRRSLSSFLKRVYFDLQNLGKTSKDRALNFAATNAFQAASSFAQAVSTGMELDTIEIEKSPFCRVNSDCWDVKLKFFDPERGLRAKKVYLFSIDVSYMIPVTLGQVRSWSVPK